MLAGRPLEERRSALSEALGAQPPPILVSQEYAVRSATELDRLFDDARIRGNEGLLLKRRGSVYESGKRSGAWLKLKRPYATLDVVVTMPRTRLGRSH